MAQDIFLNKRGVVSAFDTGLGTPVGMFVPGWGGFYGFKSIITEFTVREQGGVQFMHTLQDMIYIYVFGDRISQMNIRGLSFWDICSGETYHGLEYVQGFYLQNRVSQLATPVQVIFGGGTAFSGFLVGLSISLNNPENYIGQFDLDFKVIPEQSSLG